MASYKYPAVKPEVIRMMLIGTLFLLWTIIRQKIHMSGLHQEGKVQETKELQGSHLETQHKNPNFSSYKKLITAGSYQSSKVSSKSQDEIRDPRELDINHMRGGSGSSQAGSAFESYNKASPLSTFGKNDSGAPRSPGKPGVDIKAMS
ncbi:hypothetical protein MAR_003083, partial [Mya arenaria]